MKKISHVVVSLAAISALYLYFCVNSLFEHRVAFLYLPESDDLYQVELTSSLSEFRNALVPFRKISYSKPSGAEYRGKLGKLLAESERRRNLRKNDFDAYLAEIREKTENLSFVAEPEIEFANFAYFPVYEKSPLPALIIGSIENINPDEANWVQVAISHSSYNLETREMYRNELQVAPKALLIHGMSAARLYQSGI